MMGRRRRDQDRLFYEFRLEDRIPENVSVEPRYVCCWGVS